MISQYSKHRNVDKDITTFGSTFAVIQIQYIIVWA